MEAGESEQEDKAKSIHNAMVIPTLMYGSELWVLNKRQESAIQTTEKRVLRYIAEKRMVVRVRIVEIRDELKQ